MEKDLRRHPQGSAVYLDILERVRSGRVEPGQKLVDTSLAGELNVSRMPVREALLRLTHEGYLVGTTRGFMLPQLSGQDVADIFEVRKLLEPRAAAAAAHAMDDVGLAALEAAYRDARKAVAAKDVAGSMDANTRFRQAWLHAVPNGRLANTIARFVDHVQTVRMATMIDVASQEAAMELLHELIVGFRERDALFVHDCMSRFIDRAQEHYLAVRRRRDAAQKAG